MKKLLLLISFFVFLSSSFVFSQSQKWIDFAAGNDILALAEDNGNLWIGTNGGVVKMDLSNGQETFYNRTNSSLPSNVIYSIALGDGEIYFGSEYAGITKFNKADSWQTIRWDTYSAGVAVNDIANEGNGKIWVAYQDGGLSYYDGSSWTDYTTWNSQLPSQHVYDVYIAPSGAKWVGTGGGLVEISGSNWTIFTPNNSGLPSYYIYKIAEDDAGNLWLATPDKGVIKYDGQNWTAFNTDNSPLTTNTIYTIEKSWTGGFWFGTKKGLFYFDGTNWTHFDSNNTQIPSTYVYTLLEDSQHRLWVGTPSGLCMYNGNTWAYGYNTSNSPITTTIYDIVTFGDHSAYIGTDQGLFKYDGETWTNYTSDNSYLPSNRINSLDLTEDGKLLIGTIQGGAAMFDGQNFVVYKDDAIDSYTITAMAKDDYNNIWFGLNYNGVVIFNGSEYKTIFSSDSTFPDNDIQALYARGNYVWVATHHGLARYDLTTQSWKVFDPTNSGLPGYGVIEMHEDKNKNLWALVPSYWNGESWDTGGLAEFVNGQWQALDRAATGIESKAIYSFDIDNANNFWIATGEGLVKYMSENNFVEYTVQNSVIPTNNLGAVSVDSKGNVWFAAFNSTQASEQVNLCIFNENGVVLDVERQNPKAVAVKDYQLYQNYPNPFNPTTTIEYAIPKSSFVSLKVYNVLGKEIATLVNQRQMRGHYSLSFNASELPSGVYFYRLQAGNYSVTKKMVLAK